MAVTKKKGRGNAELISDKDGRMAGWQDGGGYSKHIQNWDLQSLVSRENKARPSNGLGFVLYNALSYLKKNQIERKVADSK
jgi:hypothetical protein